MEREEIGGNVLIEVENAEGRSWGEEDGRHDEMKVRAWSEEAAAAVLVSKKPPPAWWEQEREREQEQAWGGLPEELRVKVVAHLPFLKVLELRAVCKSWNSLPRCPAFLQAWSNVGAAFRRGSSWLVMARESGYLLSDVQLIAFCQAQKRWFRFPSSQLCNTLTRAKYLLPTRIGSAGGLVCCPCPDVELGVFVFNPLTNAVKTCTLPQPVPWGPRRGCITMVANPVTRSYRVMWCPNTFWYPGCVELRVYDSRTETWKSTAPIEPLKVAAAEEFLDADFFLARDGKPVLAYHSELDVCSIGKAPEWDWFFHFPTVAKCNSRLLFLSAVRHEKVIEGFQIWEWQCAGGTGKWVQLIKSSPPPQYWWHFRGQLLECVLKFLIVSENLVCMTGMEYPDEDSELYWPPLLYDVGLDLWQHLPRFGDQEDYTGLAVVEPRCDAMP